MHFDRKGDSMSNLTLIQNNLIPVYQSKKQESVVNARELYDFLESKQEFAPWIKNKIDKYGFVENEDFLIVLSKTSGRPKQDFILKLDVAKEIAMVENNEKGKQVRKYFISIEKEMQNRNVAKVQSKPIRLNLTESIKALPESPNKRFKYKQYTDLVYKFIFNKNSKQLREMYGIGEKETPRNYFTADEFEKVTKLEHQVSTLIELEMTYEEIKELLNKKFAAIKNVQLKE